MGLRTNGVDELISLLARSRPPGAIERSAAWLASPWVMAGEGLAAALALRAARRPAVPAALAAPSALLLVKVIKRLVKRPRPGVARWKRKGRQSFPSSHVAGPAALLACVALLAPRSRRWNAALALGTAAALMVATERVCDGDHWASDVAAGAAMGAAVGVALARAGAPSGAAP